jgi:transcriptional regulator with XRE-family HTH domain
MQVRPIFDAKLGAAFARLRELHTGWSQNHAGARADERKLPGLTRNIVWRLEQGRIKHPSANTLRSLATLYRVPYEEVVQLVIKHVYGVSQAAQTTALPVAPAAGARRVKTESKFRQTPDPVLADEAYRLGLALMNFAKRNRRRGAAPRNPTALIEGRFGSLSD